MRARQPTHTHGPQRAALRPPSARLLLSSAAPFLPLNPVVVPQTPRPDIYPGLSGSLAGGNLTADAWNKHVLQVLSDERTLAAIFNQGRADAAAWATQARAASAEAVQAALNATDVAAA